MRHLVTRVERPLSTRRSESATGEEIDDLDVTPPPDDDDIEVPDTEFIDESETEAAPAAID
jgi:hypothetical protein